MCTIDRDGADENRDESLEGIPTKKGYDRDEWPMVGSVYYNTQSKVTDGMTSTITDMTYNEAKQRTNPITASKYYKNGQNSTVQ